MLKALKPEGDFQAGEKKVKVKDSSYELGKTLSVVGDFSQVDGISNAHSVSKCDDVENSVDTKLCTFPEIKKVTLFHVLD